MKIQSLKTFQRIIFAATFLVAFSAFHLGIAEASGDACLKTSKHALQSCRAEAQSDYSLALARCDNDPVDATCSENASAEQKDSLQGCKEEFEARLGACEKLGPDPYDPVINPADFVAEIDNPYFPLIPGTTFIYEGQTSQGLEHGEFAVKHKKRVILGVPCTEVRDTVWIDGKIAEDTLDWFAQDKDGNVWYFGENTHELENGLITTIDGTFMAGVDRAKPGIIMKAQPNIGDFYRQEFDLRNAEDFAEVIGLNASVKTPLGNFNKCLRAQETTPLEPDLLEHKIYCRGIGNVVTIDRVSGDQVPLIQIRTR